MKIPTSAWLFTPRGFPLSKISSQLRISNFHFLAGRPQTEPEHQKPNRNLRNRTDCGLLRNRRNREPEKPKMIETRETGNRGFQPDVETVCNRTQPGPSCRHRFDSIRKSVGSVRCVWFRFHSTKTERKGETGTQAKEKE